MKPLAAVLHLPSPAALPNRLRVLVKEAGSPRLTGGGAEAFDETIVIAQMKGETSEAFAERAVERVEALGRAGKRLSAAALQTGLRHDAATVEARHAILVALLGCARLGGDISEVVVEASSAGADDHYELLLLVDGLLQRAEADGLPVRLRFHDIHEAVLEADSGVFWLAPSEFCD